MADDADPSARNAGMDGDADDARDAIEGEEGDGDQDEGDQGDDAPPRKPGDPPPPPPRNYITRTGYQRLRDQLQHLLDVARPEVVQIVSWAAKNGDRSENGDYLYGKRRLREIDRRIRFLTRRLDIAEVVDSSPHVGSDQIFFGATVVYYEPDGTERRVRIVGIDEIDPLKGMISWISPVAKSLLRARAGDTVVLRTPQGRMELDIDTVEYEPEP